MLSCIFDFFFNDTATTEIYTLSLHDALPISFTDLSLDRADSGYTLTAAAAGLPTITRDRKSTRLNSSHSQISYAVFCLKKKKDLSSLSTRFIIQSHTTIVLPAKSPIYTRRQS